MRSHDIVKKLVDAGKPSTPDRPTRLGTVTSVSPLTVQWDGESDTGLTWPKVDAYSPTIGDRVYGIKINKSITVAGSVNGTTTGTSDLPGVVKMYGAVSAPSGYLLCDGSAVSRTTYAALFAVIGANYGAGDGSTTFNLPNMTGAFPRGNTVAVSGGSATHTHPLSANGYAQLVVGAGVIAGARETGVTAYTESYRDTATNATAQSGQTSGTPLAGATDSASTLPPYLGFSFIIKT